jgi:hypothetical protein
MKWILIFTFCFIHVLSCAQLNDSSIIIQISYYDSANLNLVKISNKDLIYLTNSYGGCIMDLPQFELKDSLPNGNYEIYHNEIIQTQGTYLNNTKNGIWKYYFNEGKDFRLLEWKNGIPIKRIKP